MPDEYVNETFERLMNTPVSPRAANRRAILLIFDTSELESPGVADILKHLPVQPVTVTTRAYDVNLGGDPVLYWP